MKEEKMLRAFSLVDDELVENAAPKEQKPKTPLWWKRIAYVAVAACLSLAVILPIAFMGGGSGSVPVLSSDSAGQNVGTPASPGATTASPAFDAPGATVGGIVNPSPTPSNPVGTTGNTAITTMPVPSDTELIEGVDQNKEYLPLYEMLSAYISESKIDLPPAQPTAPDIAPGGVTTDFSGNLTGADAIQKTDTHIFCLKDNKIEAYVRSGDGFLCVGAFEVGDKSELYLLDGGKKMLLIGSSSLWTRLLLLDVRDPTCMKELRRVRITGKLNSHAMTEDGFVVATNYTVWEAPDYDNPTSFVPYLQVDGGAANHLAMQDIIIPPDKALGLDYAVTYSFDAETLTLQSRKAVLGSGAAKITENYVFICSWYYSYLANTSRLCSDLYCFDFQDGGLTYRGNLTLDGRVSSLDEKDGVLRVVADVSHRNSYERYRGASFYCISLQSVRVVAALKEFTEDGQSVQSVCFDGDMVYVATQHATSSPTSIYLIDFSKYGNIVCVTPDEPIARSMTLAAFGDGAVVGIGYGDRDDVGAPYPHTVGIFKREGDKAVAVAQYRVENATEATGHLPSSPDREYFMDIEKQLVGFAVKTKDENGDEHTEYLLLGFDGERLSEVARVTIGGDPCAVHTLLLDGRLHIFGEQEYRVIEL